MKKKKQQELKPLKKNEPRFLVICRHLDNNNLNDGYRLTYETFDEAYRKFLHTIWYYMSMKHSDEIICAMYQDYHIVYNYIMTAGKSELVDCFDGTKSTNNLTADGLSKMILTAVMEYESALHNVVEKRA